MSDDGKGQVFSDAFRTGRIDLVAEEANGVYYKMFKQRFYYRFGSSGPVIFCCCSCGPVARALFWSTFFTSVSLLALACASSLVLFQLTRFATWAPCAYSRVFIAAFIWRSFSIPITLGTSSTMVLGLQPYTVYRHFYSRPWAGFCTGSSECRVSSRTSSSD